MYTIMCVYMYIGLYTGKGKYQEVAIRLTKDHISKY